MTHDYVTSREQYVVVGHLVVAETFDGQRTYVYRNGLLPEDTVPAQVRQLLAEGFIRPVGGGR
ncbi:hypothetical protein [Microbacterium sp.]|uniref:hypothetical protein n=1 Tax=Microbacterium sp. TaxID=51671 RepID=UPI003F72D0B7